MDKDNAAQLSFASGEFQRRFICLKWSCGSELRCFGAFFAGGLGWRTVDRIQQKNLARRHFQSERRFPLSVRCARIGSSAQVDLS